MAYVPVLDRVGLEGSVEAQDGPVVVPASSPQGEAYPGLYELHLHGRMVLVVLPTSLDGVSEAVAMLRASPALPVGSEELFRPLIERLNRAMLPRRWMAERKRQQ